MMVCPTMMYAAIPRSSPMRLHAHQPRVGSANAARRHGLHPMMQHGPSIVRRQAQHWEDLPHLGARPPPCPAL